MTKEEEFLVEELCDDLFEDDLKWNKLGEFVLKQESTQVHYQIQDIVEPKDFI